ncbi:heme-degrading domain-containing protein [Microbacterium sp. SS28]|uniref:heme-degrading domain-containing protein n=1 Tax=Microbacterium sp. SS28 TaxID=2919948 RepID=UPI001FAAB308|nr:heme-degrading domain-containing protein [Microbacterium sp. SS28]
MVDRAALGAEIAAAKEEQARLTLPRFTNADAWALGSWAVETSRERGLPVVIDIRRGEQQLFHAAMDGTNADNDAWIERKARTVRRFAMASYRLGQLYGTHLGGFNEATQLPFGEYVAAGGCVPITVTDVGMIGTFTVSGLPEEDDHALAVEALEALLKRIAAEA